MNNERIPIAQLCTHYNIKLSFIAALNDFGLLKILTIDKIPRTEQAKISQLETLVQLHYHLDIKPEGLESISHVLMQREKLHEELSALRNRLHFYESH